MGRGASTIARSPRPSADARSRVLLPREQFRQNVFARDENKCVVCGQPAVDAHHLIERRLWSDGGYYIENGVSLCAQHHLEAEQTLLSPEELRQLAGINSTLLPPELDTHEVYDKWGNILLPNGQRSPGPLFDDSSVQKVLGQGKVLDLFTEYVKYPRTPHLAFSGSINPDDIVKDNTDNFIGEKVIITEKLDGECTVIYSDGHAHARSLDSGYHPSRTRVKALAAKLSTDLPSGWRICGENLAAKHSIEYKKIPHFMVFSIWNEKNQCLSWQQTKEWAELLDLPLAPVLYEGEWDEDVVRCCWHQPSEYSEESEGFVVRMATGFSYRKFSESMAKFVRPEHIADSRHHWLSQQVDYNDVLEF